MANDRSPYTFEMHEIEKTPVTVFVTPIYDEKDTFAHGDMALLVFNGMLQALSCLLKIIISDEIFKTSRQIYLPSSSEFDPAVGSHCKIGQFSNADLFLKLYLSWMGSSRIRTENTIKCINGSRGTDHL